MLNFQGCPAGGSYSSAVDLLRFDRALREHRLLRPEYTLWYFTGEVGGRELATGEPARWPIGMAGGGPGVSASLESDGDLTIVVLANQDPPVTEEISRHLRRLGRKMAGS